MKKSFVHFVTLILLLLPVSVQGVSENLQQGLTRLAAKKGPYTFVVMGDNRSGDRIYKRIIELAMERNPDFIVNVGDVIVHPGNRNQWKNFKELSAPISVPYLLAAGNHDIGDETSQSIWQEEVDLPGNELYYSWTVGKSLFVVLNSCEPGNDRKITGAQLAWLKKTLDPKQYDHQFVFLHHPLYLHHGTYHYGDSLDRYPLPRNELQDLFAKKKVDIVFAGHEHAYYKNNIDGVLHVITGGAGARLYGQTFSHFVIVKVDGKRIEIKAIDKEGAMRDQFFVH